jgi:carbonic anhydrase
MFDDLLRENYRYAAQFSLAGIPAPAAKHLALVTCMDSRIEPLAMLGLVPGDAKILRNAGGRVTPDVLRSLILATAFLGVTRIAIMQHTRCAMAFRTDEDIRADLPPDHAEEASTWEFLAMPDPDASLREDVARCRQCELIPSSVPIEGWRYSVDTGAIAQVITSP